MVNLIYTEFLKLHRSRMFLISLAGATVAPLMCFIGCLGMSAKEPQVPIPLRELFVNTNEGIILLTGVSLYGIIAAYVFYREYAEDTLKNLLTIPVSRGGLMAGKSLLLFGWVMLLTLFSWALTLLLATCGPFTDWSAAVIWKELADFMVGGLLLFLLIYPVIFVTLVSKNYVPVMVFTIAITMVNLIIIRSEYRAVFPWMAVYVIASHGYVPEFPPAFSFLSIAAASLAGFSAALLYFLKADVQ